MFIAHLPAGYLGACLLTRRAAAERRHLLFVPFVVGSIFPDADMLYFYLIDQGRHLHHDYWTHLPVFWLAAWGVSLILALILRSRALALAATSFVGGVFLHLLLDTPFAGIRWLYPLSDQSFFLVTVPATRSWWVWSFVVHWTFLFEIVICIAALLLLLMRRRRA
ncbi:metal-dependent hydrolase [Verrucomicrobium spinosum]|uniref:metal-dependent hydrolase n=1 Tax=Verrucomicrobium spinosum TaxID=2736 RepID=UPI0001745BDE|nr:metal-dependent hydrolase [Verrucomicrobium spinosum]